MGVRHTKIRISSAGLTPNDVQTQVAAAVPAAVAAAVDPLPTLAETQALVDAAAAGRPTIDLRDFRSVVDLTGTTPSDAGVALAIAQAAAAGVGTPTGADVLMSHGKLLIALPIKMPRNGATPRSVVTLSGTNIRSSTIVGHSTFPPGRGMIEWSSTPAPGSSAPYRVWHNAIRNLTLALPEVAGVRAILHEPYQTGTARAGGAATIQLATTASLVDSNYNGNRIEILSGTGAGQSRTVSAYVGSTRMVTVSVAWATQPDVTSVYAVVMNIQDVNLSYTDLNSQWLQCDVENVLVEGSNQHHEVLIDLKVGVRCSTWRNIYGDPWRGNTTNYATLLIRTPSTWKGVDPYHGEDSVGFSLCTVSHVYSMIRRGGWTRTFEGRMNYTTWNDSFDQGPPSSNFGGTPQYGYRFVNSFCCNFLDLASEGLGCQNLFRFTRCKDMQLSNLVVPMMAAADSGWTAGRAYVVGERVAQTAIINGSGTATHKRYFTCTVAGTSGAIEPTWPDSGTVADGAGTLVWTASVDNSFGEAAAYFEDCEEVTWKGHFASGSNPVASARLSKQVIIDANSKFVRLEDFSIRGLVASSVVDGSTDAANEITISAPPENYCHAYGTLLQSFGDWSLPYTLGNDARRPSAAATLDFGSIAAAASATLTVTVMGAVTGNAVIATPPATLNAGLIVTAWVSANNTVTIRLFNATAGAIDPTSGSWRVAVLKP